jgi:Na+/phosphate symporter
MKQNWFYKKTSIKKLWIGAIVILVLTVLAEIVIALHPNFEVEALFGFHALFGFVTCIVMVVFAKLLGFLIKRKDDYYDQ